MYVILYIADKKKGVSLKLTALPLFYTYKQIYYAGSNLLRYGAVSGWVVPDVLKALQSLKTSEIVIATTKLHIKESLNLLQHCPQTLNLTKIILITVATRDLFLKSL